ncbi:hypothetical protein [Thiomicrorhabdus sp.]|uniref:hypothetical protein n=1 Tax=Thiomicrorhabdus sp. TaxID=2039724 RepID=UPI002AA7B6D5|nr:hypothetical protein [Thiomicrorhabdus sp.]
MKNDTPLVHYLSDYQAPKLEIQSSYLTFDLQPTATVVTNSMKIINSSKQTQLSLDGEQLKLVSVFINSEEITQKCQQTTESLIVCLPGLEEFELTITTESPHKIIRL